MDTYSYVHQRWMLKSSKLGIEGINILLGETDDTLNVPQLREIKSKLLDC